MAQGPLPSSGEPAEAHPRRHPRVAAALPAEIGVPPNVPITEVSLEQWVVVRNGALTTAGMPCGTSPCGHAATMDQLFESVGDAEHGAREQLRAALARPRGNERREIRQITVESLPVRDYRDALIDMPGVEFARQVLGHGNGGEARWEAAMSPGCGGLLLPRGSSLILFVFRSYGGCIELGPVVGTMDLIDVAPPPPGKIITG